VYLLTVARGFGFRGVPSDSSGRKGGASCTTPIQAPRGRVGERSRHEVQANVVRKKRRTTLDPRTHIHTHTSVRTKHSSLTAAVLLPRFLSMSPGKDRSVFYSVQTRKRTRTKRQHKNNSYLSFISLQRGRKSLGSPPRQSLRLRTVHARDTQPRVTPPLKASNT